jgi:UDP-N-acetyl-D-mannosaminuronic acid dehydrogenase
MEGLTMNENTPSDSGRGLEHITVRASDTFLQILSSQSGFKVHGIPAGIALVVDDFGVLIGTISDGDIRRGIVEKGSLNGRAEEIMTPDPVVFNERLSHQEILKSIPSELRRRNRSSSRFLGKIVLVDDEHKPKRVLDYHHLWEQRVATHRHVSVIGLGYVGLTLALTLADKGYQVTGVDVDKKKIDMLKKGELYVHEIGLPALFKEHLNGNFTVSTQMPENGDVFIVSVGTPVHPGDANHLPSLEYLRSACEMVGAKLGMGALVVLRSTVPIGTTRDFVMPLLEKMSGLRAGTDFHLAFAPERTVEGNALRELLELPQIIGGINGDSVESASALFREINAAIVRVGSCESAEMAKLINNCFRDLIFSFSNEMGRLAAHYNIDIVKVIKASNSGYPRDPVPLPSPGVGGPCLTKDPYILASVAHLAGISATLGERGREINESMIGFIADRIEKQLIASGKNPSLCKILICGLAFKGRPETGDLRNSPALDLCVALKDRVGFLYGHDPVASDLDVKAEGLSPVAIPAGFQGMDAVLFMNNHPSFRKVDVFTMVRSMAANPVVFDGWNLFDENEIIRSAPAAYLGLSHIKTSVPLGNRAA